MELAHSSSGCNRSSLCHTAAAPPRRRFMGRLAAGLARCLALCLMLGLPDAARGAPVHRNYVYAKLLADGNAPTWAELMSAFQLTRHEVGAALRKLDDDHDVVLLPQQLSRRSEYILMCHPFSNLPTHHTVDLDLGAVRSALDALRPHQRSHAVRRVLGRVLRFGN